MKKKLFVLSIPFSGGASMRGCEHAPRMLKESKLFESLSLMYEVVDLGDINISLTNNREEDVYKLCDEIKQKVITTNNENSMFLFIGGDHSISIGTISGMLEKDNNLGVIWVDAHADINNEITTRTHNIHGMPVAALMGKCVSKINNISKNARLHDENMFWLSARALGKKELSEHIKYHDNIYGPDKIKENGIRWCLDDIILKMDKLNIKNIHISFDVDSIDPSIFFATGVKFHSGLDMDMLNYLLDWISKKDNIISLDFVEYNPLLDDENMTNKTLSQSIILKCLEC